jgi:hypothetical protein
MPKKKKSKTSLSLHMRPVGSPLNLTNFRWNFVKKKRMNKSFKVDLHLKLDDRLWV